MECAETPEELRALSATETDTMARSASAMLQPAQCASSDPRHNAELPYRVDPCVELSVCEYSIAPCIKSLQPIDNNPSDTPRRQGRFCVPIILSQHTTLWFDLILHHCGLTPAHRDYGTDQLVYGRVLLLLLLLLHLRHAAYAVLRWLPSTVLARRSLPERRRLRAHGGRPAVRIFCTHSTQPPAP